MPDTTSNIAVRSGRTVVITGSRLAKVKLTADDMVKVNIADPQIISGIRCLSAGAIIHTGVFRASYTDAVVHIHLSYVMAQSLDVPSVLRFSGYELIKRLGIRRTIAIPVFGDHADISRVGIDIERHL